MAKPDEVVIDTGDVDIEEVLREVLVPLLQEVKTELTTFLTEEVKKVAPKPQESEETEANGKSDNPEVRALQKKLAAMEQKAQEAEAKERQRNIDQALTDAMSPFKFEAPSLAMLALKHQAGEIIDSNGSFITKDGKSLSDLAKEFSQSAEGKRLLPAHMREGSGAPNGRAPRTQGQPELTTDEMLAATFGRL